VTGISKGCSSAKQSAMLRGPCSGWGRAASSRQRLASQSLRAAKSSNSAVFAQPLEKVKLA